MSYKITYREDGMIRWLHRSSYYDAICEKNKLLAKGFHDIKIEDVDKFKYDTEEDFEYDTSHRKVQCIETGELFDTAKRASEVKECCHKTLLKVLLKTPHYKTAGGYHWRYVYVS